MTLELSSGELLLALGALISLIVLLILGTRWYLRKKNTLPKEEAAWSNIKHLAFDPLRHNGAFFQIGLIAALALTLLAFNWTQQDTKANFSGELSVIHTDEIEIVPPRTTTPPPVIPPPPVEIEAVPEEEVPEEVEDFVDNSISWNDEVIFTEPSPKAAPEPAPAPLPVIEDESEKEFWVSVEKMPAFPGCEDVEDPTSCTSGKVMNFIYKNLKYPSVARENGVEGTVVISFIINKEGKISDIELLRDIGAGCDQVTLKSVEKLQKKITFSPGMQQGRKVKVKYNLPIRFKLQ